MPPTDSLGKKTKIYTSRSQISDQAASLVRQPVSHPIRNTFRMDIERIGDIIAEPFHQTCSFLLKQEQS